jgi:hypothetical protein
MGALQGYSLEKISNPWTILDMPFVDDIVIQWHQKFLGIQPSNDYSNLSVKRNGQTDYYIHQIENCSQLPLFGIENRATNQREFTVTLPTSSTVRCTDVVYDVHDNTGKLVANITKWWDGPKEEPNDCMGCICTPDPQSEIRRPNAYVIDVYNERMSGENRLGAIQKTALIGATLLIEFAYYLPQPIPRNESYASKWPLPVMIGVAMEVAIAMAVATVMSKGYQII